MAFVPSRMTPSKIRHRLSPLQDAVTKESAWSFGEGNEEEDPPMVQSENEGIPYHPQYRQNRDSEFLHLEPPALPSTRRQQRLQRDAERQQQFESYGDALWELRAQRDRLLQQLQHQATLPSVREHLRQQIRQLERRDPEHVYRHAVEQVETLQRRREPVPESLTQLLRSARSAIHHFQFDGLWIGKYAASSVPSFTSNSGTVATTYDLINVTYVGDILVATKLTSHQGHVPAGEISFQVDLAPSRRGSSGSDRSTPRLPPIVLSAPAALKWGIQKLSRFLGLGQVAEAHFTNHQWIPGQLIVISENYFSFAWLNEQVEQQIFFGRPSPEMALKLLSQRASAPSAPTWMRSPLREREDEMNMELQKEFAQRCLERTHEEVLDELEYDANPYGGIWHCNDAEECYFE
jgi:Cyclin D1 binding domain